MDWLDLLALQGTLKSLLQYHSSKASILRGSAFLTVQLSHPYMTTGKTIAWTRWTFVGKVMLKILQTSLQQYMNRELPDVQAGFRKGRGTREVLEKTLESPLDCKEIQPVHPERDQSWGFFGRNDAKAETLVL